MVHSARGGGSLAMALGGVSLEIIKKFGRWLSDAVHLYVSDAPILTINRTLANTMMSSLVEECYKNFTKKNDPDAVLGGISGLPVKK